MKKSLNEIIKYGIIGIFNTTIAYLVFAIFLFLDFHYTLATFIGGFAGLLVGYQTIKRYVFSYQGKNKFFTFILIFFMTYALNIVVQKNLRNFLNPYLSGAIASIVSLIGSYLMNKKIVFAHSQNKIMDYGEIYAQKQIKRSKNPLRKWIRSYYLKDIASYVQGPALDVGCGSGDLLRFLPPGSLGLEINPVAVDYCRKTGLNVELYDPNTDNYKFNTIKTNVYKNILFNHVLEHLENPNEILKFVFESAKRLGIQRIILTLPCERGFKYDPTHQTFVDENYLKQHELFSHEHFELKSMKRFPLNSRAFGKIYTFNELRIVFVDKNA